MFDKMHINMFDDPKTLFQRRIVELFQRRIGLQNGSKSRKLKIQKIMEPKKGPKPLYDTRLYDHLIVEPYRIPVYIKNLIGYTFLRGYLFKGRTSTERLIG